jgi:hypothetical protein
VNTSRYRAVKSEVDIIAKFPREGILYRSHPFVEYFAGYSGILVGCMARFGIAQFRARAQ